MISGFHRMRAALSRSMLSRPRGLWERLTFPMLREAYAQGFREGYGTGHAARPCSTRHREYWLSGYIVASCQKCGITALTTDPKGDAE